MAGMYARQWGSPHPGCLIILLDQSGSMADPFPASKIGAGKRKCDMVATILNNFLHNFIEKNTVVRKNGQPEVRPRADVAVLGYEGTTVRSAFAAPLGNQDFVSLPDLSANPIDIEKRKMKQVDDTGQIYEIPVLFPIWVKPTVGLGTPMCAALERAKALATQWISDPKHAENYPPVVINVTDGMCTDGDPTSIAQELCQLKTADGNVLLYNVHITDLDEKTKEFPLSETDLPDNSYAKQLFKISSIVPETSRTLLNQQSSNVISENAHGMIFNGDAESVQKMFILGTTIATPPQSQSSTSKGLPELDKNR